MCGQQGRQKLGIEGNTISGWEWLLHRAELTLLTFIIWSSLVSVSPVGTVCQLGSSCAVMTSCVGVAPRFKHVCHPHPHPQKEITQSQATER